MFDDGSVAVEVSGRTKSSGDNVWLQRGVTVQWNVTSMYKARERTLACILGDRNAAAPGGINSK